MTTKNRKHRKNKKKRSNRKNKKKISHRFRKKTSKNFIENFKSPARGGGDCGICTLKFLNLLKFDSITELLNECYKAGEGHSIAELTRLFEYCYGADKNFRWHGSDNFFDSFKNFKAKYVESFLQEVYDKIKPGYIAPILLRGGVKKDGSIAPSHITTIGVDENTLELVIYESQNPMSSRGVIKYTGLPEIFRYLMGHPIMNMYILDSDVVDNSTGAAMCNIEALRTPSGLLRLGSDDQRRLLEDSNFNLYNFTENDIKQIYQDLEKAPDQQTNQYLQNELQKKLNYLEQLTKNKDMELNLGIERIFKYKSLKIAQQQQQLSEKQQQLLEKLERKLQNKFFNGFDQTIQGTQQAIQGFQQAIKVAQKRLQQNQPLLLFKREQLYNLEIEAQGTNEYNLLLIMSQNIQQVNTEIQQLIQQIQQDNLEIQQLIQQIQGAQQAIGEAQKKKQDIINYIMS